MPAQSTQTNTVASVSQNEKRLKIHPRTTAPAKMAEVIGRRSLGHTKQRIARELGMSRNTVDSILNESGTEHDWSTTEQRLIPKAYKAIEKAMDRYDHNVSVRFLENVVWSTRDKATRPIDQRVQMAIGTLITPQLSASGTEAAAKAPLVTKSDQVGTQNLPILDCKPLKTHELAKNSAQLSFSFMEDP